MSEKICGKCLLRRLGLAQLKKEMEVTHVEE